MLELILLRLKFWSFAVLPAAGLVIGHILQFLLGTKHNPKYESLVVHVITTSLMMIIFAETSKFTDQKDQALFLSILYLFVLGVILGLISVIY